LFIVLFLGILSSDDDNPICFILAGSYLGYENIWTQLYKKKTVTN